MDPVEKQISGADKQSVQSNGVSRAHCTVCNSNHTFNHAGFASFYTCSAGGEASEEGTGRVYDLLLDIHICQQHVTHIPVAAACKLIYYSYRRVAHLHPFGCDSGVANGS